MQHKLQETSVKARDFGRQQRGMEKLLNISQISGASNVPVRSIRTLVKKGIVPVIVTGHRSHFFQASKFFAALQKYQVKSAADRNAVLDALKKRTEDSRND